ncbi:MAG: DNA-binding response regulator [Gammaproteobacteria bacterium RBG_16_57_12]|nr:MAG: DNA-binding response regulator [Gammaproteobacteria bacterium RBG_16_57_12]
MRILVVEDEQILRHQLETHLRGDGFAVDTAADGRMGAFRALEYPYDLAIIDLGLPEISGIEIIRQARAAGRIFPILILTAQSRWQDKVAGLEAGADDYLTKPFHMEELQARIRALLRRAAGITKSTLRCGPLTLDNTAHKVMLDDQPVELTAYEYRVLEYLVFNADKVISKTELTEHIYDQDFDRDSNVIEVFIRRLRRKLDPDNKYNLIETLRGHGYRFTIKPEAL